MQASEVGSITKRILEGQVSDNETLGKVLSDLEASYSELGSWKSVAGNLGIQERELRRARRKAENSMKPMTDEERASLKVFISHQYQDSEIADVIAENIKEWGVSDKQLLNSGGKHSVVSKVNAGEKVINGIRQKVDNSNLFILVFTNGELQWEWQVYELGLAMRSSEYTRSYTFQIYNDTPPIIPNERVVKLTLNAVDLFVKAFHLTPNFFIGFGPYQKLPEAVLEARARKLYEELVECTKKDVSGVQGDETGELQREPDSQRASGALEDSRSLSGADEYREVIDSSDQRPAAVADDIDNEEAEPEPACPSPSTNATPGSEQFLLAFPSLFPTPWANAWGEDRYGIWAVLRVGDVEQTFRWIPPGRFWMGSPADIPESQDWEDRHLVTITEGFWLGDTCITQALWREVMDDNPSHFQDDERPVEQVSWDDAQLLIKELNRRVERLGARLPTEAEWEYACRAGTKTAFSFGDEVTAEQANYDENHRNSRNETMQLVDKTVPVKSLPANPWGLYEMHGNVWEWCQDFWTKYLGAKWERNAAGPQSGPDRVVRGGSWVNSIWDVRSSTRFHYSPESRIFYVGFRLALGHSGRGRPPEAGGMEIARRPNGRGAD